MDGTLGGQLNSPILDSLNLEVLFRGEMTYVWTSSRERTGEHKVGRNAVSGVLLETSLPSGFTERRKILRLDSCVAERSLGIAITLGVHSHESAAEQR